MRRERVRSRGLLDEKIPFKLEKDVLSSNSSPGGQKMDAKSPLEGQNMLGEKRKREESEPFDGSGRTERDAARKTGLDGSIRADRFRGETRGLYGYGRSERIRAERRGHDGWRRTERVWAEKRGRDGWNTTERIWAEKRRHDGWGRTERNRAEKRWRDGSIRTERAWVEKRGLDGSGRTERTKVEERHNSFDSNSTKHRGGSSKDPNAYCERRNESDGDRISESRRRERDVKEESDASILKISSGNDRDPERVVEGNNCSPVVVATEVPKAITSCSRKKLLVLDLNGLLCHVVYGNPGSSKPHKRVGKCTVFKRPFCDEFMKFCCEKFDIGVWSSRKMENVVGVVDFIMAEFKDRLLFCWDASKCTYTGYQTVENRNKPLVLKQLNKIWNKEGSLPWEKGYYSSSNTLLIDDSPYKALCNPPYTGIFPHPYSYNDDDDSSLGPGGDLRVYLEGLAFVDDVRCYVQEHPFGKCAITTKNASWKYYEQVVKMINRSEANLNGT